jgi:hypothetical protein
MGITNKCLIALVLAAVVAPAASAPSPSVTSTLADQVTIDWSVPAIIADGIGLADRRAPTPDVARAAARTRGVDDARKRLRAALVNVPWADGKTVGAHLNETQLNAAAAAAIVQRAEPQTDGSWRVRLMLPIEALQQVVQGPRGLAPGGDTATLAVVAIDAKKVAVEPRVGWQFNDGGTVVPCTQRWVTRWDGPTHKATAAQAGVITLSKPAGIKPATLCVIIVSR